MSSTPLPPDLQGDLEELFEMFARFVAATSANERALLYTQMLEIFSRFGIASEHPLVLRAAEVLEKIRPDQPAKRSGEAMLAREATFLVNQEIRRFEKSAGGVVLTSKAKQILRIPVAEAVER